MKRSPTEQARDIILEGLLVREGVLLTPIVARERANNIATALMELLEPRGADAPECEPWCGGAVEPAPDLHAWLRNGRWFCSGRCFDMAEMEQHAKEVIR